MLHLKFILGENEYGIDYSTIENIGFFPESITPPPENSFINICLGCTNFKGKTYSLIDSRYLLENRQIEINPKNQVIYLNGIGLVMTHAVKTFNLNDENFELKKKLGLIKGIYTSSKGKLINILDAEKIKEKLLKPKNLR